MLCLVTQSYPTLCNPMDCSPPGPSVCGDSPGKNTRVGYHVLLHGVFPIQRLNPGLLHCRRILYHLSPGKPKNTGVGSLPLLQGNFLTQELSQGLRLAGDFLYQMSYWGSPCIRLYTTYFIYCLSSLDNNGKTIPNFLNKVINTLSGTQSTL